MVDAQAVGQGEVAGLHHVGDFHNAAVRKADALGVLWADAQRSGGVAASRRRQVGSR